MPDTVTIQLGQRGVLTLPQAMRERYGLRAGDTLTCLDLDGVFVLSPRATQIDALADRLSHALVQRGESLESALKALREERERYGRRK